MIFKYINKGYIRRVIAVCCKFAVLKRVVSEMFHPDMFSLPITVRRSFRVVTRSYPANIRAGGYKEYWTLQFLL